KERIIELTELILEVGRGNGPEVTSVDANEIYTVLKIYKLTQMMGDSTLTIQDKFNNLFAAVEELYFNFIFQAGIVNRAGFLGNRHEPYKRYETGMTGYIREQGKEIPIPIYGSASILADMLETRLEASDIAFKVPPFMFGALEFKELLRLYGLPNDITDDDFKFGTRNEDILLTVAEQLSCIYSDEVLSAFGRQMLDFLMKYKKVGAVQKGVKRLETTPVEVKSKEETQDAVVANVALVGQEG
ncbi:MAG: hypothetical protein ABIM99_02120, partial [Candidatus Dojkabacteria bacterium]